MADKKDDKKLLKSLGIGAALGTGAYGVSKAPWLLSKIPEVRKAQKMSKGKVTRIVSETASGDDYNVRGLTSENPLDKLKNWYSQAGIRQVEANKIPKGTKMRGTVYDDVAMNHPDWSPTKETGVGTLTQKAKQPDYKVEADIIYNKDKSEFLDKLQDKYTFSQMKEFEGYTPKSRLVADVLKNKTKRTGKNYADMSKAEKLDSIADAVQGEKVFIKMRGGEGFGAGFQGKPDKLKEFADLYKNNPGKLKKQTIKDLETLADNPKSYIAQDLIKGDKEYRVHVALQGGKASTTQGYVKQINGKKTIGEEINVKKDNPELEAYVQKAMKNYSKSTKGDAKNQILGLDVLVDSKTGKKHIVEINDNSGSWGAYVPKGGPEFKPGTFEKSPKMQYRQLTGRLDSPTAAKIGLGIGGTGTAAEFTRRKINERKNR